MDLASRWTVQKICAEINGSGEQVDSPAVDESDLSVKKLDGFQTQLLDLQKEKSERLHKVLEFVSTVHYLCAVLGMDFFSTVNEVHPSLNDSEGMQSKSISNDTLSRLAKTVLALKEDKKQRLKKVEASTNQSADQQMPMYNLPPKILCTVVNVDLKAEPDADEVYAQVTLMPEPEQDETAVKKEPLTPPTPCFHVHSFCKTLTASDTSTHGGFSVLRRHADECLPPLDMSRQPPTQELVAKDLHGNEWRFRHIF